MAAITTLTGAQFDALPYEEGRQWELLDGELIPVPSPTPEHQILVQEIQFSLLIHLKSHPEQGLSMADVEFALDENSRVRPDVFVLGPERAARLDRSRVPIPGAPDLAVEVISPSERSYDTQAKLQRYLQSGTQEVWHVYPLTKSVTVYRGGTGVLWPMDKPLTTPLLPGFSLDLQRLFAS
jgi:Uma2 family endonuclease